MNLITKPDSQRRRIAAVGMYDGVHCGHRFLIDFLRREGESRGLTPTAVTFSRHPLSLVRPLQAPQLLTSLEDRVQGLGKAGAEDVIVLSFNENLRRLSAEDFLKMLHKRFGIDALVLGFNNHFGHDMLEGMDQYRAIGKRIDVEVIPAPEYTLDGRHISSSSIRRLISEGKTSEATTALGHPYAIRGYVSSGHKLGRTLGFPTANVTPPTDAVLPKTGAYAAFVTTPDGVRRPAMVNVGFRPTLNNDTSLGKLSIEAHIFNYIGYLYDEDIMIEFIEYMRGERRFASTEKLKAQLEEDAAKALKKLKSAI